MITSGSIMYQTMAAIFPCSLTHPERSGPVETVTHRYFESMASKCLIIGHAPRELIDLFGYNPAIEMQANHEFKQLQALLDKIIKRIMKLWCNEQLARYVTRPAIANERLSVNRAGRSCSNSNLS